MPGAARAFRLYRRLVPLRVRRVRASRRLVASLTPRGLLLARAALAWGGVFAGGLVLLGAWEVIA